MSDAYWIRWILADAFSRLPDPPVNCKQCGWPRGVNHRCLCELPNEPAPTEKSP